MFADVKKLLWEAKKKASECWAKFRVVVDDHVVTIWVCLWLIHFKSVLIVMWIYYWGGFSELWSLGAFFLVLLSFGVNWYAAWVWGERAEEEKSSPYECGFSPKGDGWTPFSCRFFHLAIMYLLWDVEGVLIVPVLASLHWGSGGWQSSLSLVYFVLILFWGYFYEFMEGSIAWTHEDMMLTIKSDRGLGFTSESMRGMKGGPSAKETLRPETTDEFVKFHFGDKLRPRWSMMPLFFRLAKAIYDDIESETSLEQDLDWFAPKVYILGNDEPLLEYCVFGYPKAYDKSLDTVLPYSFRYMPYAFRIFF